MGEDYSAAGPLGGYLWQLRKALVHLLKLDFGSAVTIEKHDDICVVRLSGEIITALQAKHSFATGTITARAPELWKTLRVWAGIIAGGGRLPTAFVLATTHDVDPKLVALDGENAAHLDVNGIITLLDGVADEAGNRDLKSSYAAWAKLSVTQKAELLSRIRILASAGRLDDVTSELRSAIRRHYIPDGQIETVSRSLEGWFIETISRRLDTTGCQVTFDEVWELLRDQHREYRAVAPPPEPANVDDQVGTLAKALLDTKATFVRQLQLLGAHGRHLEAAAKFYARARVARDTWLDQAAVARQQIKAYVSDLYDHWAAESGVGYRDLDPSTSSEDERRDAGWAVHDGCISYQAPFGPRIAPKYLTVGSYHLLADEPTIGWHPDYRDRLKGDDDE